MGWLFSSSWASRKDLIKELTATESNETRTRTCLAHCLRGNVLWTVWEITYPTLEPRRYIGCDLLQKVSGDWGYKDLYESCGPFYWTCPPKYLEMVPEVANQEWRDEVMRRHNLKTMKLVSGTVVGLQYCSVSHLKVIRPYKGGAFVGETKEGGQFVARRKHLSGEILTEWPA